MRVWLDALTSKQGRLAACLALHLKDSGYETFITCREYECTRYTIELYGLKPTVVGEHGGGTRLGKLLADANRVYALARLVGEASPKALVAYPNPSAARVAFGLGIPYIALNDTPHAEAANRLSLPLCSVLVAPEALRGEFEGFLSKNARVFYYDGVDEVLWVKMFKPTGSTLKELKLERRRYVVVRPEEFKAAYYSWGGWGWLELCDVLKKHGLTTVVLPRYEEQRTEALKRGLIVPTTCVDGLDLVHHSLAVVTGGGTMAREAALLGIPSYYTFPLNLKVSAYVQSLGFPLKRWDGSPSELAEEVLSLDESQVEENVKKAREMVVKLKTPDDCVLQALKWIGET